MKIKTLTMHQDIADKAVCSNCQAPFTDDRLYCQVSNRDVLPDSPKVWIVCIGCAAIMACT